MASAAEQMAANLSWGALGKATDLRQRILFTIGLLIVYRLGTYIPVPGIDGTRAAQVHGQGAGGHRRHARRCSPAARSSRMGIFALGIMPYISASIIVQLLASMVPPLEQLKKEGEAGRKKINQYTRYGTVRWRPSRARASRPPIEAGGLAHRPGHVLQAGLRHHAGRRHACS